MIEKFSSGQGGTLLLPISGKQKLVYKRGNTMRTVISKDGTSIAFNQSGQGPALILVAGALTTCADWSPLAARLALEYGAAGILVSNHGGRQLDSVVAGIEALPEVVEAVAGRCEVYVDGGVRRGTDVLKALALGARAVLIGRPILWGLAVNGERGVRHVLQLLRAELELAMALAGWPTLGSITRSLVR